MIIRSASILALLREKTRRHGRDGSHHLLCPACRARTKLYALGDGRKKCGACGKKFHALKKTDNVRLRQYADLLACFCLDFTARQASDITGHHYRLVSSAYGRFRTLLATQNLTPGKMALLRTTETCARGVHESAFCARCSGRFRCRGRISGDSALFGVKILAGNRVFFDPLTDAQADARFEMRTVGGTGAFSGYAGFVCKGKFHRFADNGRVKDGAEQLWAWMSERLRRHHGIGKKNIGLYMKELEWKYNNRGLTSEKQALGIAEIMPADFLTSWKPRKTIALDVTRAS